MLSVAKGLSVPLSKAARLQQAALPVVSKRFVLPEGTPNTTKARLNAVTPKKETGIVFPKNSKGERSTSEVGKAAFAAAVQDVDPVAAQQVLNEKDWRFGYPKHVLKNVELSARSYQNALKIANSGLSWLERSFEFVRDGKALPLVEAMGTYKGSFETGVLKGKKPKKLQELEIEWNGQVLKGLELRRWLDSRTKAGSMEPTLRDALCAVMDNPQWMDLSDKHFVLMGAGSALGPLTHLLKCGANVIALDLNQPHIWRRILSQVENSSGSVTFPLRKPQSTLAGMQELSESAGCNLITDTPEITNWLLSVDPGKPLAMGMYAYLDAALHVLVSVAVDAIMKGVYEHRKNISLSYMPSPTDIFAIPTEAHQAAELNLKNAPLFPGMLRLLGPKVLKGHGHMIVKTTDGSPDVIISNGLVVAQGPNYALAKRMQHWRAMVAREAGCLVSSNVGPPSFTASVVHNKQFEIAYNGCMKFFPPMEPQREETARSVMFGTLVHDLCNPQNPVRPSVKLSNPLYLFAQEAFHGGVWRSGFQMEPMFTTAAYLLIIRQMLPKVLAGVGLGAGLLWVLL